MKKLMMIAAMMVATVSASAQFEPGTFSIQPKVGINLAKVSNMAPIGAGDYKLDRSLLGGAVLGAEAEYQIAKPFSVAAGLLFSMQGCQWQDDDFKLGDEKIEVKDTKIALNYLNLPGVANFYLFKGFAVKAGAQFGFLTSADMKAKLSYSGDGRSATTKFDEDVKDEFNKFDFSIPVGISYEFKIPICIDVRYNIGITKVNKDSEPGGKDNHNGSFSITIGYKIKL